GHLAGKPGGRRKFYRARAAESSDDGDLQRAHMITLDPKLIDVIWNAQSERVFAGVNEFDCRKPALEGVGTHVWPQRSGQFLPQLSEFLIHTNLLTVLH